METVWHLLSPVGVHKAPAVTSRPAIVRKNRRIGLLSNRKPNATPLLENLIARLHGHGYETRFYQKRNSATPAGAALLDQVSAECGWAVVASAD